MVVTHHVVSGNWTQDLWKSSQCLPSLSCLSSSSWYVFNLANWWRSNITLHSVPACMRSSLSEECASELSQRHFVTLFQLLRARADGHFQQRALPAAFYTWYRGWLWHQQRRILHTKAVRFHRYAVQFPCVWDRQLCCSSGDFGMPWLCVTGFPAPVPGPLGFQNEDLWSHGAGKISQYFLLGQLLAILFASVLRTACVVCVVCSSFMSTISC